MYQEITIVHVKLISLILFFLDNYEDFYKLRFPKNENPPPPPQEEVSAYTGTEIGLMIVVPVAFIILVVALFLIWRHKRKIARKHEGQTLLRSRDPLALIDLQNLNLREATTSGL